MDYSSHTDTICTVCLPLFMWFLSVRLITLMKERKGYSSKSSIAIAMKIAMELSED